MASETPTVVSDQSTVEHVEEKKASESIENVDQENAMPSKKIDGRDGEEKVNYGLASGGETAESELKKNTDYEKTDVPAVVEAMKTEEIEKAIEPDVLANNSPNQAESSDQTPMSPIPVPETAVEVAEKESVEPSKASDVPESPTEAVVEKPMENIDAYASPEPELKEAINAKVHSSETSVVLGSAPEDEIKQKEQSEVVEEEQEEKPKESEATEIEVCAEGETEKKINETLKAEESATVEVPNNEKSLVEPEVGLGLEDMKKQDSKNDVVEVPSLPPAVDLVKDIDTTSVAKIAENVVKADDKVKEEKEEENFKTDELAPTGANNTMDSDLNSAVEVTKDSLTSGDVGIVTEEKEKNAVKGGTPTSVETSRDKDVEGADSKEPIDHSREPELEVKPVEPTETNSGKKAEEVNEEAPKTDSSNLKAPPKEGGDKVTAREVTKQVVVANITHRQSTSILSKLKQSIVKVKKAIMGKSSSSKTLASKGKGEIKAK